MKVILKADVKNVGSKNEVVEVSSGYASNMLIPKGLAVVATEKEIKKLQVKQDQHHQELKNEAKNWMKVKAEIESKTFVEFGKSQKGILLHNISRKHVLELLNSELSTPLNKTQLPNKYEFGLGNNSYPIELYPGISTIAHINIKEKK